MNDKLLALFEENPASYISGEELSVKLQISRTAVWKQVEQLRRQGYEFDAMPRRGYCLLQKPQSLRIQSLIKQLKTKKLASNLLHKKKLDSTQEEAKRLLKEGASEGTIIIAEEQTMGRGRMGKKWYSPAGKGLWFSQILKPSIPVHFTPQLTLLTAVALCRAIRRMLSLDVGIKWPNDLLIKGKKVSGILVESSAEDERLKYVIVGVGISVNVQDKEYPDEIRDIATSLRIEYGAPIDREALLLQFLHEWDEQYDLYLQEGFQTTRTLWETYSVSLHRNIKIHTHQGCIEGVAEGLDPLGGLILKKQDGSYYTAYSGEVH